MRKDYWVHIHPPPWYLWLPPVLKHLQKQLVPAKGIVKVKGSRLFRMISSANSSTGVNMQTGWPSLIGKDDYIVNIILNEPSTRYATYLELSFKGLCHQQTGRKYTRREQNTMAFWRQK